MSQSRFIGFSVNKQCGGIIIIVAMFIISGCGPPRPVTFISQGQFITNDLSGKCIDAQGTPGEANRAGLQLWDCEYGGKGPNSSPTDQMWQFTREGFIVNTLSGKCIDVQGAPGMANRSDLQLWDCEYDGEGPNNTPTDQIWRFTGTGYIRNSLSGKCIDVQGAPGKANRSDLQLWDCEYDGKGPNNTPTDQIWHLPFSLVRSNIIEDGNWPSQYREPPSISNQKIQHENKTFKVSTSIIKNKTNWNDWVIMKNGQPALTKNDFSKDFVVVIRAVLPNGAYTLNWDKFEYITDRFHLMVNTEVTLLGAGCRAGGPLVHPFQIVQFSRNDFDDGYDGFPKAIYLNVDYREGAPCSD